MAIVRYYDKPEYYIMPEDAPMDIDMLSYWMNKHQQDCIRYKHLRKMYEGKHPILFGNEKPKWKPDNRITVNFAKYIVDTLNGYFIGNPIKTYSPDEATQERINDICRFNDQDDNNFELSKICSIYGAGFEMLYTDEMADVRITYLTPLEAFVIYDDSVERKPLYGVRYFFDNRHVIHGTLYTRTDMYTFTNIQTKNDSDTAYQFVGEGVPHYFSGVPLIEYIENEERQGAFEHVEHAICAYEKALSEKANDVDSFADAYMLIKGLDLSREELFHIRNDRVIQVQPMDADDLNATDVEFLQRPSGDTTQENLLDRLEKQIFNIAMVANISDEEFGGSSGTALAYKLQPMKNLASVKSRKFASGMNQRWKLIASLPVSGLSPDSWATLRYRFTFNAPQNLLEEAQTANQMSGITSKRTQLSVLSAVDDIGEEMAQIDKEENDDIFDGMNINREV